MDIGIMIHARAMLSTIEIDPIIAIIDNYYTDAVTEVI